MPVCAAGAMRPAAELRGPVGAHRPRVPPAFPSASKVWCRKGSASGAPPTSNHVTFSSAACPSPSSAPARLRSTTFSGSHPA
jgi:hypothetical protein